MDREQERTRLALEIIERLGHNPNWGRELSVSFVEAILERAMQYGEGYAMDANPVHLWKSSPFDPQS